MVVAASERAPCAPVRVCAIDSSLLWYFNSSALPFNLGQRENSNMSSGFTRTFRLTALVLLIAVMQVYVLAHPRATSITSATKNSESVNKPVVTDHQVNFIKQNQVTSQGQLASERSVTFAPKSPMSLAFNRTSVERSAAKTTFLKVKKGTYDLMMSSKGHPAGAQTDDSDDDSDGDRKTLYIASAIVIGAAVALFIGFRHDRDDDGIKGQ